MAGRLTARFRFASAFTGTTWGFQSARVRWTSRYGNCLSVGAAPVGLKLSIFFLFRPGHPSLFLPWSDPGLTSNSKRRSQRCDGRSRRARPRKKCCARPDNRYALQPARVPHVFWQNFNQARSSGDAGQTLGLLSQAPEEARPDAVARATQDFADRGDLERTRQLAAFLDPWRRKKPHSIRHPARSARRSQSLRLLCRPPTRCPDNR